LLNAPSERPSLKKRVIGAGAWSLFGFGLSNAIRLGSSLMLTRLLVPQMFGLMAMATLVMTGLAMVSDLGLRLNIVQSKRGGDANFLNTAWTIQIVRGLVLWLLALCISIFLFATGHLGLAPRGSVYADPRLPFVIFVISFSVIIDGLQSTKLSEASRHLALGRVTVIQIVAQIIGLTCMMGWVLIDRSIWALVAGGICASVVTTTLSHTWLPGVANRWQWDRSAFYEIVHFGKWMFLSSILGFFANNGDRVLLGGLVDSTSLGIYAIAFNIFNSIVQILSKIIGDVSYSAISEVAREQSLELKRSLYRFHVVIASVAYFCSGLLIVSGNALIGILYDRRYGQAGWMLEILAIALLAVPFNLAQLSLLARGLPRIFTHVIAIRVAATVVLIPLGFQLFGIPGALWGFVGGQLSSAPATVYYQQKYDLFDLSKELLLLPTLCAGMIIGKWFNHLVGH
jgi:O-antigen/teichoic acid export membrane protein